MRFGPVWILREKPIPERIPTYRRLLQQALDACAATCWNVWGLTAYDFNPFAIDDATMMKPWSLLAGGQAMFTMPRIAVLRGMIFNHIVHHRGQLTVYLRLNDIPVPALYAKLTKQVDS